MFLKRHTNSALQSGSVNYLWISHDQQLPSHYVQLRLTCVHICFIIKICLLQIGIITDTSWAFVQRKKSRGLLSFPVDLQSRTLTGASKASILDRLPEVSKRL